MDSKFEQKIHIRTIYKYVYIWYCVYDYKYITYVYPDAYIHISKLHLYKVCEFIFVFNCIYMCIFYLEVHVQKYWMKITPIIYVKCTAAVSGGGRRYIRPPPWAYIRPPLTPEPSAFYKIKFFNKINNIHHYRIHLPSVSGSFCLFSPSLSILSIFQFDLVPRGEGEFCLYWRTGRISRTQKKLKNLSK